CADRGAAGRRLPGTDLRSESAADRSAEPRMARRSARRVSRRRMGGSVREPRSGRDVRSGGPPAARSAPDSHVRSLHGAGGSSLDLGDACRDVRAQPRSLPELGSVRASPRHARSRPRRRHRAELRLALHRPGLGGRAPLPRRRARSGQRPRCDRDRPPLRGRCLFTARASSGEERSRPARAVLRRDRARRSKGGARMSDSTSIPDSRGRFGAYGGKFIPETLSAALVELEEAYAQVRGDAAFQRELQDLLASYVGRPTPLYRAERLEQAWARGPSVKIYLKREDLAHTGAHKINNALGQALLATRMGKRRIIAETGAGQHGVATATACALLGLECRIYMGTEDTRRQALNVFRMRLLGAEVVAVDSGSRTLKDAINEAMRDWVTTVENTHYVLGSVLGPHPFPMMVRDFQAVIGREARAQIQERE